MILWVSQIQLIILDYNYVNAKLTFKYKLISSINFIIWNLIRLLPYQIPLYLVIALLSLQTLTFTIIKYYSI